MELILAVCAFAIFVGLGFALILVAAALLAPAQRGLTHAAAPLIAAKSLLMWGLYELLMPAPYSAAADRPLLGGLVAATCGLCIFARWALPPRLERIAEAADAESDVEPDGGDQGAEGQRQQ